MFYFYIIAILSISMAEGLPLIKKGMRQELFTISSLIGISVILLVLGEFGLSTPLGWLHDWLVPIGKSFFKYH